MNKQKHPDTPDGRYFVVRGRLWRRSDPSLAADRRDQLVRRLMLARNAVKTAKSMKDEAGIARARRAVDRAKHALGERGPVWWKDGEPDYNRHMVRNSPYSEWYDRLAR